MQSYEGQDHMGLHSGNSKHILIEGVNGREGGKRVELTLETLLLPGLRQKIRRPGVAGDDLKTHFSIINQLINSVSQSSFC